MYMYTVPSDLSRVNFVGFFSISCFFDHNLWIEGGWKYYSKNRVFNFDPFSAQVWLMSHTSPAILAILCGGFRRLRNAQGTIRFLIDIPIHFDMPQCWQITLINGIWHWTCHDFWCSRTCPTSPNIQAANMHTAIPGPFSKLGPKYI